MFNIKCMIVSGLALAMAGSLQAALTVNNLFGDHMVLPRDKHVSVWGTAEAGQSVSVTFAGQSLSCKTDKEGNWSVKLAPMAANAVPQDLTITGGNTLKITDILLGDVWVCSGQSNMEFKLASCKAVADIKAANMPQIRWTSVPGQEGAQPMTNVPDGMNWHVMSPDNAGGCSAVGFYFARKVNAATQVPIGVLCSAQGGSCIESWLSPEAICNYPQNAELAQRYHAAIDGWRDSLPLDDLGKWLVQIGKPLADAGISHPALAKLKQWQTLASAAVAHKNEAPAPPDVDDLKKWLASQNVPLPAMPEIPGHPLLRPKWFPGAHLYNGRIAPLTKLPIKGMLWYQGENGSGKLYYDRFKSMIETDRKQWQDEFPVYFVQLPNMEEDKNVPQGDVVEGWPTTRMQQLKCLQISRTGMAVTIDVGDPKNLHPTNKCDMGERLALWALAKDYHKKIAFSGPLYQSMRIANGKIILSFDHVGSGLMVGRKDPFKPAVEDMGGKLKRFAIAGEDKKWVWADAVIVGVTVRLSSPEVPRPVAARYAYSVNPAGCNLYNQDGLPASPFRTDNW